MAEAGPAATRARRHMSERSASDAKAVFTGFSSHEHLLTRLLESDDRAEWLAQLTAYAQDQDDLFAQLINRCPFGIYIVDDAFRIVAMNERCQTGAFSNVRPVIGRAFEDAIQILWPETTALEVTASFRRTLETGTPYHSTNFVARRADTGETEGYEWELHRTSLGEGRYGVICYYFDSTELRQIQRQLADATRRQQLMIDELNHRVKNMLMIVQSLAQQTFGRDLPAEKRQAFEGRLGALSQAHDALTRASWQRADLSEVISGAVNACGASDRINAQGPKVWLESRTAVTMAMAIHELCTNAMKYGSLSTVGGHVELDWSVSTEHLPELTIRWREVGGPPVKQPERRGFGTRMLNRALAGELKAQVEVDFSPGGLACTIVARNRALFRLPREAS